LEIIYGLINSVKGRTKEINIASGETIMFCLKNRFFNKSTLWSEGALFVMSSRKKVSFPLFLYLVE
jgi:hypothetical protein